MAVDFQTLEWNKSNDLPYVLLLPTFNAIAGYHHKLSARSVAGHDEDAAGSGALVD